ncbi:hypothetical protein [Halocola ammonii]
MSKIFNNQLFCFFFGVVFLSSFYQCSDIIEEDLSDDRIEIILPADSQVVTSTTPQFRWEEVDGAMHYRIQIVQPNFESPLEFQVDSTIGENSVYFSMNPGTYQWRVRAENGSSHTPYSTRTVFIDSTSGIQDSQIILSSPANGAVFSDSLVSFDWEPLIGANSYSLKVFENENGAVGDQFGPTVNLTSTDTSLVIPEGIWFWRVQGFDGSSQSQFTQRSLTIDQSAPSLPVLTSPIGDTLSVTGTTEFEWQSGIDEFTITSDSIFVYDDQDLTDLVMEEEGVNNSIIIPNSDFGTGRFYWIVKTYDSVGNFSESEPESFDIEP